VLEIERVYQQNESTHQITSCHSLSGNAANDDAIELLCDSRIVRASSRFFTQLFEREFSDTFSLLADRYRSVLCNLNHFE
jgi:hypothetical protein